MLQLDHHVAHDGLTERIGHRTATSVPLTSIASAFVLADAEREPSNRAL